MTQRLDTETGKGGEHHHLGTTTTTTTTTTTEGHTMPELTTLSEIIETALDACCEAGIAVEDENLASALGRLEDALLNTAAAIEETNS